MNEVPHLPLLRDAALAVSATVKRTPWLMAVPAAALGLGSLVDWLLAPLLNVGLLLAAPLKGLAWSAVVYAWRRSVLEGSVDGAQLEAELVARTRSLGALSVPLLYGSLAFLTLAWGGSLAVVFGLAVIMLPALELLLLGGHVSIATFFARHAVFWVVSQTLACAILFAAWLSVTMSASVVHVLVGEVVGALVGGVLLTACWLWRGHLFLALERLPDPEAEPPPPPGPAPKPKPRAARPPRRS